MPVIFLLYGLYSAGAQQEVFLHGTGMAIPFMNHPPVTVTVAEKKSPNLIIGQTVTDAPGNYSLKITTTETGNQLVNPDKNEMLIYPNPFSGTLNIEFYAPVKGDYLLDLTDISGRKLITFCFPSEQGINTLTVQNIGVNGMIVIRISGTDKIITGKAFSMNLKISGASHQNNASVPECFLTRLKSGDSEQKDTLIVRFNAEDFYEYKVHQAVIGPDILLNYELLQIPKDFQGRRRTSPTYTRMRSRRT